MKTSHVFLRLQIAEGVENASMPLVVCFLLSGWIDRACGLSPSSTTFHCLRCWMLKSDCLSVLQQLSLTQGIQCSVEIQHLGKLNPRNHCLGDLGMEGKSSSTHC